MTGKRYPDPLDLEAQQRAEAAEIAVAQIWVDHPPQRIILVQLMKYLRVCKQSRGKPLNGRRLSEESQAGKSSTIERMKFELAEEDRAAGREVNPYRLLHITIDRRMTLKMLYQEILHRMADEFIEASGSRFRTGDERDRLIKGKFHDNIKVLEQRIAEWVPRLGVEAIVVDEVQHLHRSSDDASEVTKKLQAFLDRGVVPLVFVGDETSRGFFDCNPQFAARLMRPLELQPLEERSRSQRKLFKDFCANFDRLIVEAGLTPIPSRLDDERMLDGLIAASGGHVGRVARLLQIALPSALERGAASVELYDLANAVDDYAIGLGWIDYNPFLQRA
ncbi:TniB family NTP-binding protein [Microcoleus sp. AT9b-C5]